MNAVTAARPPLTSHLQSLSTPRPYSAATEHPFLLAAGNGKLPDPRLALWLAQDRIYAAHAYPRFIGLLIAKIPYKSWHTVDSPEQRQNDRILKILSFALENVVREVAFFRNVSTEHGLELNIGASGWRERKGTRDYTAEMMRIASSGTLEEGLVFLWAMEQAYLDAWKYAKSVNPAALKQPVKSFVENWTSPEFEAFVKDLADLVNDAPPSKVAAEEIWARIVELEEGFWPDEGEEQTMRAA